MQRVLVAVDEEGHVGEGRAGRDAGHQGHAVTGLLLPDQAVHNALAQLQAAPCRRQHADGEAHALQAAGHMLC